MIRMHDTRTLLAAAAALALLAVVPSEAQAQQSSRWAPFTGCWEILDDLGDATGDRLCIEPGDSREASLWRTTFSDGESTEEIVLADGEWRDVVDGACVGETAARFSDDGRRVYLDGRLDCDGPDVQPTSGMLAVVSGDEWIDVRSLEVEGEEMAFVQRYRRVSTLDDEGSFDRSMRMTLASATPSLATITEVSREVADPVTVAWLSEVGLRSPVDASQLIALDDQGVSDPVIDAVVALSNPNRFAFGSRAGGFDRDTPGARAGYARCDRSAYGPRRRIGGWGRFYGYSPWDYYDRYRFGYGGGYGFGDCFSPYASRFGYGYGYGGYGYYPSPVIIVPTNPSSPSAGRQGGRAVNGRGYVAPRSGDRDRSQPSASSGGRSGGSGSASGGTRRAKPRGGGGGTF